MSRSPQGGRRGLSEVVVGVDVGTTLIKAAAFDRRGRVVALAQAATVCETPRPGWVEVEMEGLWRQVAAVLRELAGRLGGGHPIRAIGISAFMGGAWLVDRDGRPVRNAIAWHDARAVTVLDELRAAGLLEPSFAISCNALTPGFALVVLRWLREHEPAVLERAHTLLFAKDWIRFRLTGETATDGSDASHAPGDARQRTFSPRLLEEWGLGELNALLPPVLPSGRGGRVRDRGRGKGQRHARRHAGGHRAGRRVGGAGGRRRGRAGAGGHHHRLVVPEQRGDRVPGLGPGGGGAELSDSAGPLDAYHAEPDRYPGPGLVSAQFRRRRVGRSGAGRGGHRRCPVAPAACCFTPT